MKRLLVTCAVIAPFLAACAPGADGKIKLGTLSDGATASLVAAADGKWGIEITRGRTAAFAQPSPVQIEVYVSGNDIRQINAGYDSTAKKGGVVTGQATVETGGGASFLVSDQWAVTDGVLTMKRAVSVIVDQQGSGVSSAIRLVTNPETSWE
ncbi:MAG: hypothetical protein FIB01_13360, partial [Gemmatimonadetes bacterium]|nr:hypothetical protein [Gemmatimonadota bacterium]